MTNQRKKPIASESGESTDNEKVDSESGESTDYEIAKKREEKRRVGVLKRNYDVHECEKSSKRTGYYWIEDDIDHTIIYNSDNEHIGNVVDYKYVPLDGVKQPS